MPLKLTFEGLALQSYLASSLEAFLGLVTLTCLESKGQVWCGMFLC
jgi:hypothetical protein